ncbi:hypothetical protein GCM10022275_20980 [Tessaracoccus defluvii]
MFPEVPLIAGLENGDEELLLGMPQAQHLFHSVYAMSGALADVTAERSEVFGRTLAAAAGVEPTLEGFSSVPEGRLLDLQKADAAKALRWVPRGLLLGKLGVPKDRHKAYLAANADVVAHGKARLAGRVLTDRMFRTAVLRVAADRGDAPTWLYRFAWESGKFGFAEHCLDVPFFFDCLDGPVMEPLAGPNPPQALADEVHAAAVAFITGGDPGWPRHDDRGIVRVFARPSSDMPDGYASVRALL